MRKELYIQAPPCSLAGSGANFFPRDWWGFLLMSFIVGVMTIGYVETLSSVVVIYGVVFSFLYILHFLYYRSELQPEVLIYFAWVVWSLGGLTNVVDKPLYFQQLKTIVQIGVLIFATSGITALRKDISSVMFGIIAGGVLLAASILVTGEVGKLLSDPTWQARSLTGNDNDFAYCLLIVIIASFFFLRRRPSLLRRTVLWTIVAVTSSFIVLSASRKGFMGVIVFIFLWWLFCREKKLSRNMLWGYVIVVGLIAGISFSADYVIHKTYLGQRINQVEEDTGNQKRIQMYEEGYNMIKKYPFFGVGLNNYRRLSSFGLYSHSDYTEVTANTGIVGAILYFSIFIVLWRRLGRIKVMARDPELLYTVGILRAGVLVILLLAFGRVNVTSKLTWIFLAAAIGYSWAAEKDLTALKRNRFFIREQKS
jgi:O-antigen ligase